MTEPDSRPHPSAWKASLDSGLVQRLNRPLTRSGIINRQMANAIINRADPLHDRLPLMDQQMQRWARVIDLETPPLAIVYAQPTGQYPAGQPESAMLPGASSPSSLPLAPADTHPAPTQFPLVQAEWVLAKDAETIGQAIGQVTGQAIGKPIPEPVPSNAQATQATQAIQATQTTAQQEVVSIAPLSAAAVNETWNPGAVSSEMPQLVPPPFKPISPNPIPDPTAAIGLTPSPTTLGQPDQRVAQSTNPPPPQTEPHPRPIRAVPVVHHPDSQADHQLPRVRPLPDSSQIVMQMKSMPIVHVKADQALPQTPPSTAAFQANRESGNSRLSPAVQSGQPPSSHSEKALVNKLVNPPINKLTNEVLNHPTATHNNPQLFVGEERGARDVLRERELSISTGLLHQPPTINSQVPSPFQAAVFEQSSPDIGFLPSSTPSGFEALPSVANITSSQAILQPSWVPFEYTFLPRVQPTQPIAIANLDHKTVHQSEQPTQHQSETRTKRKSEKKSPQGSEHQTQHRSIPKSASQTEIKTQNKSDKKARKSGKKTALSSRETPEAQSSAEISRVGKQYRSAQGEPSSQGRQASQDNQGKPSSQGKQGKQASQDKQASQGKGLQPTAAGLAIPAQVRSIPRGFAPLQRKATQSATPRVATRSSSTPLQQSKHLSAASPTTTSSFHSHGLTTALLPLSPSTDLVKPPIATPLESSIRGDDGRFSWNSAGVDWPSIRTVEPLPFQHIGDSGALMETANPASLPLQRQSSPAFPIAPTIDSAIAPTSVERPVPGLDQSVTPLTGLSSGDPAGRPSSQPSFETQNNPPQFGSHPQSPVHNPAHNRGAAGVRSQDHPTPLTSPPIPHPTPQDQQPHLLSRVQPQPIPQSPFERFEYTTLLIDPPPHPLVQPALALPSIERQTLDQAAHHFANPAQPVGAVQHNLPTVAPSTPSSPYPQPLYPQGEAPFVLNPPAPMASPASQHPMFGVQAKSDQAPNSPWPHPPQVDPTQQSHSSPRETPLALNPLPVVASPTSLASQHPPLAVQAQQALDFTTPLQTGVAVTPTPHLIYPQAESPLDLTPPPRTASPASQNQVGSLQVKQSPAFNAPWSPAAEGEIVQPLTSDPPDTPLALNLPFSVTSPSSANPTASVQADTSLALEALSYRAAAQHGVKVDSLPPPQSLMPDLLLVQSSLVQPPWVHSESGHDAGAIAPTPPQAKQPKKSPAKQPEPLSLKPPSINSPRHLPTVQVSPEAAAPNFEPLVLSTALTGALQDTQSRSHTTAKPTPSSPPSLSTRTQSLSPPPTIHPVQMQPAIAEPPPAPPIDIETLVDKVERRLMKRLVIESERRGQKKWH